MSDMPVRKPISDEEVLKLRRYVWATPTGTWEVQLDDLWTAPGYKGFR